MHPGAGGAPDDPLPVRVGLHAAHVRPGAPGGARLRGAGEHPAAADPAVGQHVQHDGDHPAEGRGRGPRPGQVHAGVHAVGAQ